MEELGYTIEYHFSSYLKDNSERDCPEDYVNEYSIEIYTEDPFGKKIELIGKAQLSQVLFGLAIDQSYPLFDVMDISHSILQMSEILFEFDEDKDFWKKIDEQYSIDPPMNFNICLLERIEIVKKYRGQGIGKKVIQNIAQRFYESCGLLVVKAFPLQHEGLEENGVFIYKNKWDEEMSYNEMEKDFEKSQYKIFNYYQEMGFINPFEMEYFIAKPSELLS
jgi:hypothetical protein